MNAPGIELECERCEVRSRSVREVPLETGLVVVDGEKRRGFRLCRACRRFWRIDVLDDGARVATPPPEAFDESKCSCRVLVREGALHDLGCKGFGEPPRPPELFVVEPITTSPAAASLPPPTARKPYETPVLRELEPADGRARFDAAARTLPLCAEDAGTRAIADVLEHVDPPEGAR